MFIEFEIMNIIGKYLLIITPLILILFSFAVSVLASDNIKNTSHLSAGFGLEQMVYEERVPENSLISDATVSNWIFAFEGLKSWENVFVGIKGVVPIVKDDDREEWKLAGNTVQTNSLKYGWTRVDGFIGYPLNHLFYPYLGLRWSEFRQERSNFIAPLGQALDSINVIETVTASYILLGIRGGVTIHHSWEFGYGLEYLFPVSVEVENSALSDWQISDVDGYTIVLQTQLEYLFSNKISIGFQLAGGSNHWDGSDWQPYAGGRVKWPENNTEYWNGMIVIKRFF